MVVKLVRGSEMAEITADDDLLLASLSYGGIFERQVKEVLHGFYSSKVELIEEAKP